MASEGGNGRGAGSRAARAAVLARIREANAEASASRDASAAAVPRDYAARSPLAADAVADRFAEQVDEYRATVHRLAAGEIAQRVVVLARQRGARRLAVAPGVPEPWRPDGLELVEDHGLAATALDRVDGALTGCALAIAETGTLVLDGAPRSGRRALTLVPDWHACVVEADQLVGSVPEAVERMHAAATAGRPLTLVSGPSATSDIELRRVEGVHGPRSLDVLLVGG